MGLFSLFSSPSPEAAAKRIAAQTIQVHVGPGEDMLASTLGVEVSRLVSERIQLRVGLAEAAIAHLVFETKRHEANDVLKALRAVHREYFTSRPGIAPELGGKVYERATSRYIMLQPAEIAARFEEQVYGSSGWDQQTPDSLKPASARVTDYVTTQVKNIAGYAFDTTVQYVRSSS